MGPGERQHLAMDPINYLPQGPQRHSSHGDTVHGLAGSWVTGAHGLSAPGWPPNPSDSPLYFTQASSRPHTGLDPSHFGLQGALPHPDRSLRGAHQQQQEALVAPPAPFASALHSISGRVSAAPMSQGGLVLHPNDLSAQGLGAVALQPQGLVNMGPSGATSETHSLHSSLFSSSPDRLANPYGQQTVSHFATPHSPYTFTPSRRLGTSSSPTTPRPHRPGTSTSSPASTPRVNESSGLPSPVSDRRRQSYTRARRYLSARHAASDPVEDNNRLAMAEPVDGRPSRRAGQGSHQMPWDESAVRQLQLARGAAASKMIASRVALQSLQSVDINDLSDNEKMCVICYNDYGVQSPEGINEAPLRLPKCKHVFGDHCIKKWFEDSDSCPYCRDKLPSEPKPAHNSARAFMNIMRMRGYPLPTASIPEHLLSRIMGNPVGDGDFANAAAPQGRAAERRSPPDDAAGEDQRRTRQRRANPNPPDGPASASRGIQSARHAMPSASSVQDLFGGSQSRPNPWPALGRHSQVARQSGAASVPHQALQNTTAERAAAQYALFDASAVPATISVRSHPRAGTALQGQDGQGSGEPGILARAWALERPAFNPLRAHPGAGLFSGTNSNASSLGRSTAGHADTFEPSRQAGADGIEQQAPSSPFGPNRNRPW